MAESIATIMSVSYNDAEYLFRQGRIDETDWELYQFYWRNSAPRFSNVAWQYDLDRKGLPYAD